MYSKHKRIITLTFILVLITTYFLEIDFVDIASDCISMVSFGLAVYAICISNLIGSPLIQKLGTTIDHEFSNKTQLGVIKSYIKSSMVISIITIIFGFFSKLKIGNTELLIIENELIISILNFLNIGQIFSSICFALFALNFIFIILIFIFIMNKQIDIINDK
ncbi:MAG: hypothetical protein KFW09_04695 [Oscillospiraceae bacterium]|nr:hypothetical protein [Oscillospiraceae bacterium]